MEAFGVAASVAGVASLGVQITSGIAKLIKFWKSVKHAPELVQRIIGELELLDEILTSSMAAYQRFAVLPEMHLPSQTPRPLSHCVERLSELETMALRVEQEISRRGHLGSLKAAIREETVRNFMQGLERAKSSLLLSNQHLYAQVQHAYNERLLSRQNQVISHTQAQISQLRLWGQEQSPAPALESNSVDTENAKSEVDGRRAGEKERLVAGNISRTEPASRGLLLMRRSFSHYAQRAIKDKRIIPVSSPVFEFARQGNIEGLWDLFDRGLASPFDCDSYGWTLLHCAVLFLQPFTCRLLLDMGAEPNSLTKYGMAPLALVSNWSSKGSENQAHKVLNVTRTLLDHGAEPFVESGGGMPACYTYRGNLDGLNVVANYAPFESGIGKGSINGWGALHEQLTEFDLHDKHSLGGRLQFWIKQGADVNGRRRDHPPVGPNVQGTAPLHIACRYIFVHAPQSSLNIEVLKSIFQPLIEAGADLHAIDSKCRTPLQVVAGSSWPESSLVWLCVLEELGVDLATYLKTEARVVAKFPDANLVNPDELLRKAQSQNQNDQQTPMLRTLRLDHQYGAPDPLEDAWVQIHSGNCIRTTQDPTHMGEGESIVNSKASIQPQVQRKFRPLRMRSEVTTQFYLQEELRAEQVIF